MRSGPAWDAWPARPSFGELTVGIEEEFMLLDPHDWLLVFRSDSVRAALPDGLRERVTLETHAAVMEVATGVHRRVGDAVAEIARLRERLARARGAGSLRGGRGDASVCGGERDVAVLPTALPRARQPCDDSRPTWRTPTRQAPPAGP
jgi:hypothetical protein